MRSSTKTCAILMSERVSRRKKHAQVDFELTQGTFDLLLGFLA